VRLSVDQKLTIKAFKMDIVLDICDLTKEERSLKVAALTKKEFDIPFSKKKSISRTTIYQWLQEYLKKGKTDKTVLMPKQREDKYKWRSLTKIQRVVLRRWRKENVYRTIKELREELINNKLATKDKAPSESVIGRYLRQIKLDRRSVRRSMGKKEKHRIPFLASYPNRIWSMDTKGSNLKVNAVGKEDIADAMPIVIIDNHSKFLPNVKYIFKSDEKESVIMVVLMEAFEKYGVPDILYLDNGGPYNGKALKKAMAILGCKVIHTQPYDPAAKGFVEIMMRLFYEKLDTEINSKGKIISIQEANEYAKAVTHAYHQAVHSEIEEKPYERYLSYPANFRQYVSNELLSLVLMSTTKSTVSKDNIIRLNNKKYLVPVLGLEKKKLDVRFNPLDTSKIYIWDSDEFIGLAEEYSFNNSYMERRNYLSQQEKVNELELESELAMSENLVIPEYLYLERKLLAYQEFINNKENINSEIQRLIKQRADTKASLMEDDSNSQKEIVKEGSPTSISDLDVVGQGFDKESKVSNFTADMCIHLFSNLFRRMLSPSERFSIHSSFSKYGPYDEKTVRESIGKLLGQSHPTTDLVAYLDAIRLAASIKKQ
jgi:putative transposase